jgi:hypothetical protein
MSKTEKVTGGGKICHFAQLLLPSFYTSALYFPVDTVRLFFFLVQPSSWPKPSFTIIKDNETKR